MQTTPALQNALARDFYVNHNSWLYSWLCKKLGSTFDAADLAHDTFLNILLKKDLVSILEPRAYLTKIAHGLMVNHIRRREIERSYLQEISQLPEFHTQSAEARAMALDILIRIDNMLDGLSMKVRTAFLLSQLEGLTYAEIATELGVSVASVRLYIAKALDHCLAIQELA
ncbi:MAG: sigma-70 family RNA polymerase sigma factor [Nitrosomonadales bacterium]|nr:sigma-70 family RNA polymerase sigma factor [Nitrosomonadales bacterium]